MARSGRRQPHVVHGSLDLHVQLCSTKTEQRTVSIMLGCSKTLTRRTNRCSMHRNAAARAAQGSNAGPELDVEVVLKRAGYPARTKRLLQVVRSVQARYRT